MATPDTASSARTLRICVVADPASVHTGRLLRLLLAGGHEVHFAAASVSGVPGVREHVLPLYSSGPPGLRQARTLALGLAFRRALRQLRPDAVHMFGLFAFLSVGALALAGLPRLVATALGSDVVDHGPPSRRLDLARRWILSRARVVTALSRFLAARTASLVPGTRVALTPLAVASGRVGGRPRAGFTVGFAKRLVAGYGADLLLRAAALVPGLRVRLAGDGPERVPLERLAGELGIAGRVEFAGWIDPGRIAEFHAGLDLFAMPTRIAESFGLAAVEAGVQGVAAVAARIGGIAEAVEDGVTGTLVPPDDVGALAAALKSYASDPARARREGEAARTRALSLFSEEACRARWDAVYRSLLPRPLPAVGRVAWLFMGALNDGRLPPQVEDRLAMLRSGRPGGGHPEPGSGPAYGDAASRPGLESADPGDGCGGTRGAAGSRLERWPVIALVPAAVQSLPAGIDAVRVPGVSWRGLRGPAYALAAAVLAPRALARDRCVALTRLSPWLLGAYLAARFRRVPILAELHTFPNEGPEARGWNGPLVRLLFGLSARCADGFLLAARENAGLARRWGGGSRPATYLGNGASAKHTFQEPREPARARLGLGPGPWIGHLGTIGPWTDLAAMREAQRTVAARRPDARWCFVGFGTERARELDPALTTILPGVPHEETRFAASALDVGVISLSAAWDRRYGTEPLKLFTYMGCGVPVVAPDLPGVARIVRAEGCGLLFPPGDAKALGERLLEIFADPARASAMGDAGRRAFLARYSWEAKTPLLHDAIERLAARKGADGCSGRTQDPAGSGEA